MIIYIFSMYIRHSWLLTFHRVSFNPVYFYNKIIHGYHLQTSKWHHLLHSKYSKSKPELKLALYLDEDPNNTDQERVCHDKSKGK